jgi:hypothetical protein
VKTIPVTKRDILPLIYFIVSMFQQENNHRQGTSSKSDMLGGYIDRWINKIPENLLFNNLLLKDKNYKVINDYFIYGAKSDKNAPDILGLKANGNILKFAEFFDNTWVPVEGMPYIEVKSFRQNQKLVSVRETQLKDDNYYVFVESDFKPDYLISMFDDSFFDKGILDSIRMSEQFIKSNNSGIITQTQPVSPFECGEIGSIGIITVIKGDDFRKRTTRCVEKENVYYVKEITIRERVTGSNADKRFDEMFEYNSTKGAYELSWNNKQLIPVVCDNPENIRIKKINKKSLIIETAGPCSIYDEQLEANRYYSIEIAEFERSSGWIEYVGLKNQYAGDVDRTEELLALLDYLYTKFLKIEAN